MTDEELRILTLERQLAVARDLFVTAKTQKAPKTKASDFRQTAGEEFDAAVQEVAATAKAVPSAMEALVSECVTVVNVVLEVRQALAVVNMPLRSPVFHDLGQRLIETEDRLYKALGRVANSR